MVKKAPRLSRTAIMDACSAIILCKAGLHSLVIDTYNIVLPQTAFEEITAKNLPGSDEYASLASGGRIRVETAPDKRLPQKVGKLGSGERDAILLFIAGRGDFVITDDGPAARYCKGKGIPFINALLLPVVIHYAGRADEDFCRSAMERVIETGRYSPKVVAFARDCSRESVAFALP